MKERVFYTLAKSVLSNHQTVYYSRGRCIEQVGVSLSYHVYFEHDLGFFARKFPIKKLEKELELYNIGCTVTEVYRSYGIKWWDFAGNVLENTYPTYLQGILNFIAKPSRNNVFYLGSHKVKKTTLQPCISQIQFMVRETSLDMIVNWRSCDVSLGMPNDIIQMEMIMRRVASNSNLTVGKMYLNFGSLHIYEDNIAETERWIENIEKLEMSKYEFKQK